MTIIEVEAQTSDAYLILSPIQMTIIEVEAQTSDAYLILSPTQMTIKEVEHRHLMPTLY
jgi:hypothetical protein